MTPPLPPRIPARRAWLLLAALALLAGAAQPAARALAEYPGITRITAADLGSYLTFLASDELEGRGTPSRGLDTAARFLVSHLSRWALEPRGDDGDYVQRIALVERRVDPDASRVTLGGRTFLHDADFLAGSTAGEAAGPLVYVGHGFASRAHGLDPYAGLDIAGAIIVTHTTPPNGLTRRDLTGTPGVDWDDPMSAARRLGARGVVYVPSQRTLASWRRLAARATYAVERFEQADGAALPSITASATLIDALFADEPVSPKTILADAAAARAGEPFALQPHKTLQLTIAVSTAAASTQNVLAAVEGRDPALRHEYVALGAHYDHMGADAASADPSIDVIYNGADDNGSGTAALLAMAEALAKETRRPRRSVLFVWHAGEERGLWGSDYFTRYPTVPLDRIVAHLNIDMIGRSRDPGDTSHANRNLTGPDALYVIGSTLMSTDLQRVSEAVNAGLFDLELDYRYDEPGEPERLLSRSDHYHYARRGIPVIFYFSGLHEDYHRVTDTVDKIDFEKMEKVARTIYATAWALAERPARPAVDKTLPAQLTHD